MEVIVGEAKRHEVKKTQIDEYKKTLQVVIWSGDSLISDTEEAVEIKDEKYYWNGHVLELKVAYNPQGEVVGRRLANAISAGQIYENLHSVSKNIAMKSVLKSMKKNPEFIGNPAELSRYEFR